MYFKKREIKIFRLIFIKNYDKIKYKKEKELFMEPGTKLIHQFDVILKYSNK